jgi:hypothetical protein
MSLGDATLTKVLPRFGRRLAPLASLSCPSGTYMARGPLPRKRASDLRCCWWAILGLNQ